MTLRRGVALGFVLAIILAMSAFTTAVVYRFRQSAALTAHGTSLVQARLLADSGAETAVILMRDHDLEWFRDLPVPVTSERLGFDPVTLGGRFELRFEQIPEVTQGQGTFLTILSTGTSGGATARTAVTVKLTSPLTNYIFFSNGNYTIAGWGDPTISGPMFVNARGDQGQVRMWHDNRYWDPLYNVERHFGGKIQLASQIKATGKVFLRNADYKNQYSLQPMSFDGTTPAQKLVLNDIDLAPSKGSLTLTSELSAQAEIPLNTQAPTIDQVLQGVRGNPRSTLVDVSSYPDGVLAEFIDGQLVVSEVDTREVGRVFDKDLYQGHRSSLINEMLLQHKSTDPGAMDAMLRADTLYDDPDFPNAAYPPGLQSDLSGDGQVETQGDYFPVNRVVRGPLIARIPLSRSRLKSVRLVTGRTDYPSASGVPTAPPVYVRGIVEGKVSLSYDVTSDTLDPRYDRLHMVVLNDHEMPTDSPSTAISSSGPGVPGGLRYADPKVGLTPADPDASSQDLAVLISRGSLSGAGATTSYKESVHPDSGAAINYSKVLNDLDKSYRDFYRSKGFSDLDMQVVGAGGTLGPLYGAV
ncbi:MAG: hypothetical protein AB1758_23980, partial [Candidatus Eremiobacterota bacterium]